MENQQIQDIVNATIAAQNAGKAGVSDKSKTTAAVLAFFLGAVGAHRFYLGYTVIGIIQIFTLGGFFLWALIDFIQILNGNLKDSEGKALA